MAYLQDADEAARLAEIDSGGVRLLSGLWSRVLKKTVARNVSGHLGKIAGRPAAVYVAGGQLWLAIDGQVWLLTEVRAEIAPLEHGCAVRITTPTRTYEFSVTPSSLEDDMTPFVDAEDFSFGLWAARIVRSADRQQVLLDVLVDASLDDVPARAASQEHPHAVDPRKPWRASAPPPDNESDKKRSPE